MKRYVTMCCALIGAVAYLAPMPRAHAVPRDCSQAASRCSILIVETDDQSLDSILDPNTLSPRATHMPLLVHRLSTEPGWQIFTQARPQDPLCGPSRMGQLVGLTSLHHRMSCNDLATACSTTAAGSWNALKDRTYFASVHDAGYWTSHSGKFLNWYPCHNDINNTAIRVPQGFDDFHALFRGNIAFNGGYYTIDRSTSSGPAARHAHARVVGDSDYGTYVLRDATLNAIDRCAATGQPCLWSYQTNAGHRPGTTPENYNPATDVAVPAHYPSFNEGCPRAFDPSLADKPSFAQNPLYVRCLNDGGIWNRNTYQQALQAEDTSFDQLITKLKADGLFDSTVIIFTSDHGLSDNENNHLTKEVPYETAMRVPLLMHVPGAPTQTIRELAYLPDLYATVNDIAGAAPLVADAAADSRSWMNLVRDPLTPIHGDGIVGSHLLDTVDPALYDTRPWVGLFPDCPWLGVTTAPCDVLVRYTNGEQELYDIAADPYELHQLLPNPVTGYAGLIDPNDQAVVQLQAELAARTVAGS